MTLAEETHVLSVRSVRTSVQVCNLELPPRWTTQSRVVSSCPSAGHRTPDPPRMDAARHCASHYHACSLHILAYDATPRCTTTPHHTAGHRWAPGRRANQHKQQTAERRCAPNMEEDATRVLDGGGGTEGGDARLRVRREEGAGRRRRAPQRKQGGDARLKGWRDATRVSDGGGRTEGGDARLRGRIEEGAGRRRRAPQRKQG
eukprot:9479791-Pyramimonas_sp.AAC.1